MARTTTTTPRRNARGDGSYWTDPRTGTVVYTNKTWVPGRTIKGRGPTRRAAKDNAREKVSHVLAGRTDGRPETLGVMLETWLEVGVRPHSTRERWRNHRTNVTTYLQEIAHLPAHEVRPSHLETVYLRMAEAGMSRGSIKSVRTTASRAFRWAVADGRIAGHGPGSLWNPGLMSNLPLMERTEDSRTAPNPESVRTFLHTMDPLLNGPIWRLMAECSLRPSEAAGLRFEDVDLEAGVVRVRGALRYVGGEYRWTPGTKNKAGKRGIPITPELVSLLRHQRARIAELRLSNLWVSDEWAGDLIFRRPTDGRGMDYRNLAHVHRTTMATLEVEWFVPYQLRHHAPTLLVAAGVSAEVAANLLGIDVRTARSYYIDAPEVSVDPAVLRMVLAGGADG